MQTPHLCSLPTLQRAAEAGQLVLLQVLPLIVGPKFRLVRSVVFKPGEAERQRGNLSLVVGSQ